jgi:acyl-CoA hydrolase
MSSAKKVDDTKIISTELVLPHHTNQLGNLLGGQLMHWIDITAALSAAKLNNRICVTASVDKIDFHHAIKLGDAVTLIASVNRVFNTSMEVGVKVFAQSFKNNTFVSVDDNGKPLKAIEVIPGTKDEKRRYEKALERRKNRLNYKTGKT